MKKIREARIEDYDEIYALWQRTPGMGLSAADSRENIGKFLKRNEGLSFVCVTGDGRLIGSALCGHDGRRGFIYHVAVDVEHRRCGIGSDLTNRCLDSLKREGIDKCHLFVFAKNELGNDFWPAAGWTRRDDIFIYSKSL